MKALTLLQDYYHDIIYFTDKSNIDEAIAELEAQLKQRDEEIEMLQCRLYHAEGYIKDIHEPKDTNTIPNGSDWHSISGNHRDYVVV